jgi:hypothetical protein
MVSVDCVCNLPDGELQSEIDSCYQNMNDDTNSFMDRYSYFDVYNKGLVEQFRRSSDDIVARLQAIHN